MGLFNFKKNKEKEENKIDIDVDAIKNKAVNKEIDPEAKKFSLLIINFGINDYSFTLTANNSGKIVVNKSMSREEYVDLEKLKEIQLFINENFKKIKDFTTRLKASSRQNSNMIQVEVGTEKLTLFRSDEEDEVSMFYDRLVFEIANILDLKKSYENIELDFSFDYSNKWEQVPSELNKYCLLSNSKPVLVFSDNTKEFITFEYIPYKEELIEKIIENICSTDTYELITELDKFNSDLAIKSIILDYKETNKIDLFSFLKINDYIIIITAVLGSKNEINLKNINSNDKIIELDDLIKSIKILTNEDIDK